MARPGPRYGWYGDDFTGATDTLSALAESGLAALLFLRIPTAAQLAAAGRLDAVGIAGATRAMAPAAMAAELDAAGRFMAGLVIDILHYKCCSTFDSAPHIGSIGAAVRALRAHFPNPLVPIVAGQPNLGRYCLFGNLFAAAGTGGIVHRIDRHPTMSRHPVTPMGEADLRFHLAAQGLDTIGLVDFRAYDEPGLPERLEHFANPAFDAVLMDVARQANLMPIGSAIWQHAMRQPLLSVGPSGVAQALAASWPRSEAASAMPAPPATKRAAGPTLLLVGSLSPVTRAQVEAASRYERLAIEPGRLLGDQAYAAAVVEQAQHHLEAGRNAMLVTDAPDSSGMAPGAVADATATLLREIVGRAPLSRLVVAGGDTSSLAIRALDLWGLSYRAPMTPGAPLCRAHSDDGRLDGIDIVLKGGQMGPPDFFDACVA